MLQRVVEYYKRYKCPIIVGGGAVTLTYLTAYYAKHKLFQFQARAAKARTAKENLGRRFEQNQLDALYSILAQVEVLRDQFEQEINLEELVLCITNLKFNQLSNSEVVDTQGGRVAPALTKLQLWENLKIMTFTKVMGSLYAIELLGLLVYLQMNLVGRLIYVESVLEEPSTLHGKGDINNSGTQPRDTLDTASSVGELSYDDKRIYLSFSWWFINRGWKAVLKVIESVVRQVVGSIPLKQRVTYNELVTLFTTLRAEIDHKLFSASESVLDHLFPPSFEGEYEVLQAYGVLGKGALPSQDLIRTGLRLLLDETKDFIESPDFELVRSRVMGAMVEYMLLDLKERLFAQAEGLPTPQTSSPRLLEVSRPDVPTLPLAKLLPILAKVAESVFRSNSNPYLCELAECREMQAFMAIVYASFDFLN